MKSAVHDSPKGSRSLLLAQLRPEDFSQPKNATTFQAVQHVASTGRHVDEITVAWELTRDINNQGPGLDLNELRRNALGRQIEPGDCEWPLSIHADHSTALRAELLDGRLDIAIATPGPLPDGMSSRHLLDTPVVAVASNPDRVGPDCRYAVHSWQESADAVISDLLGRGIPRTHISVVSPATTAIALALHHHHVAVVPKLTASRELTGGKLTILDLRLPRLTAALDWLLPTRTSGHPAEKYIAAVESQRNDAARRSTSQ